MKAIFKRDLVWKVCASSGEIISIGFKDFRIVRVICVLASLVVLVALLSCSQGDNEGNNKSKLNVLTYNLGSRDGNLIPENELIDFLKSQVRFDLVFLQEISKYNVHKVSHELQLHNINTGARGDLSCGRAILSRHPLGGSFSLLFGDGEDCRRAGVLCVEALVNDKKVLCCSVHLNTIRDTDANLFNDSWNINLYVRFMRVIISEIFFSNPRTEGVDALLARLKMVNCENVIIAGDFNTFYGSKALRCMSYQFDEALWPSFDFFKSTYETFPFFIKPRIDFIFHSSNMQSDNSSVILGLPMGDHNPVRTDITF